jgi:hypothetical protein
MVGSSNYSSSVYLIGIMVRGKLVASTARIAVQTRSAVSLPIILAQSPMSSTQLAATVHDTSCKYM